MVLLRGTFVVLFGALIHANDTSPTEVIVPRVLTISLDVQHADSETRSHISVSTCNDLDQAARELCVATGHVDARGAPHTECAARSARELTALRSAALAEGVEQLALAPLEYGNATSVSRVGASALSLVVPWWTHLREYGLMSSARPVARAACAQTLQRARRAKALRDARIPLVASSALVRRVEACRCECLEHLWGV